MDDLIKDLEDEIMLAAFHGYRLPALEKRLEELYSQRDFDPLLRGERLEKVTPPLKERRDG